MSSTRTHDIDGETVYVANDAVLSPCGTYRYQLTRTWGNDSDLEESNCVVWIGLNPSTADALDDDPTVRKMIRYSYRWGFDGMILLNLYAYRTKDPKVLWAKAAEGVDIVGFRSIDYWDMWRELPTVACWGAQKGTDVMAELVSVRFEQLYILELTAKGYPRHPLYAAGATKAIRWHRSTGTLGSRLEPLRGKRHHKQRSKQPKETLWESLDN